jgi:hypothetical protein
MIDTQASELSAQLLERLYDLLRQEIVPALEVIQRNQSVLQNRQEANALDLQCFRAEMLARFVELHGGLATCRAQIDETMSVLGLQTDRSRNKRQIIH